MPNQAELLSAEQKAAELGVSRSTITRMVQAGELTPAYKGEKKNGILLFHPSPTVTPSAPEADRLAAGEFSSSQDSAA